MTNQKQFRKWVRWLKRRAGLRGRLDVRLSSPHLVVDDNGNAVCGTFQPTEDGGLIRVANNQNEEQTLVALRHEWAHAMRSQINFPFIVAETSGDPTEDDLFHYLEGQLSKLWWNKQYGYCERGTSE